jgi:hypothetical protein
MRGLDDDFDEQFNKQMNTINWVVRVAIVFTCLFSLTVIVVGIAVLVHFKIL